jgi:hypothetical protein
MTAKNVALALLGVMFAIACSEDSTAPVGSGVLAVEVRAPNDSLFLGRTMQLVAVAIGDSAVVTRPAIAWTSSDTLAVVVDANGLATAVGTGTAVITASVADQRDEFVVRALPMRVASDGTAATAARSHLGRLCALNSQGHAMCVVEPTAPDTIPRFALLPDATNHVFTSFASGYDADCGLKADGTLWCTRSVGDYILATGAEFGPTEVFRPVRTARRFSAFGVGGHTHICAIDRDDSLVRCWGHSHLGILGRPNTGFDRDSLVVPVLGAPPLRYVSTTQQIACGVDAGGRPVCWGTSAYSKGMRALVDTTQYSGFQAWYARVREDAPPLVSVEADENVVCGLTAEGDVHCFGNNVGEGQLGIGSQLPTTAVVRADTPVRFRSLYTVWFSYPQVCGVSVDDALYCWGRIQPTSISTALGERRFRPVPLIRDLPLEGVMLGTERRCAVTRAGGVVCW